MFTSESEVVRRIRLRDVSDDQDASVTRLERSDSD